MMKAFKTMSSSSDNLYLAHWKFFYCSLDIKDIKMESLLYQNKKSLKSSAKGDKTLSALIYRSEQLSKFYKSQGFANYVPETRLMIGVGGESPYNSTMLMTLHQTYGFPYIPATAIKGCFRNYCQQESPAGLDINKLFGSDSNNPERSKGCLVFFDTFPTEYMLSFDVMTPHDTEYYQNEGRKKPSDECKKTPLHFLCVTKDSCFKIRIACTNDQEWEKNGDKIINCLKCALREYGLGAKTAYGYGLASSVQ